MFNQSSKIIDLKYISLISNRLQLFKRKKNNLFNFRCPFCGDSEKKEFKARGYIYEKGGNFFYMCHNCGVSTTARGFIKSIDPVLYKEYVLESLQENKKPQSIVSPIQFKTVPSFKRAIFKDLKKISQLKINHKAKIYIELRKIPTKYHSMLYYCNAFMKWTNTHLPDKFNESAMAHDEARLIIPMISFNGDVIGYQGRSFKSSSMVRYITIILDSSKPKLFGLNNINKENDIYVIEGPIDSMFVKNSIAMCGSDASNLSDIIPKDKTIFVYDNEPRNSHIVSRIKKAIKGGYRVVIWPDALQEKDINDMRMSFGNQDQITNLIEENIFCGLAAAARLEQWKKV